SLSITDNWYPHAWEAIVGVCRRPLKRVYLDASTSRDIRVEDLNLDWFTRTPHGGAVQATAWVRGTALSLVGPPTAEALALNTWHLPRLRRIEDWGRLRRLYIAPSPDAQESLGWLAHAPQAAWVESLALFGAREDDPADFSRGRALTGLRHLHVDS